VSRSAARDPAVVGLGTRMVRTAGLTMVPGTAESAAACATPGAPPGSAGRGCPGGPPRSHRRCGRGPEHRDVEQLSTGAGSSPKRSTSSARASASAASSCASASSGRPAASPARRQPVVRQVSVDGQLDADLLASLGRSPLRSATASPTSVRTGRSRPPRRGRTARRPGLADHGSRVLHRHRHAGTRSVCWRSWPAGRGPSR